MFLCTQARWRAGESKTAPAFGRQAIPMVWDFAEVNPFAGAGGDWVEIVNGGAKALVEHGALSSHGEINLEPAQSQNRQGVVINTDPPYYDNIVYGDLSDFFYVWLKRSAQDMHPDLFRRILTPKEMEIVASPFRHGADRAEDVFMDEMHKALVRMISAADHRIPVVIYYAFKQADIGDGEATSRGWSTFLQGLIDAGLMIDGTWPIRTEGATRLGAQDTNSLASCIVLVCRNSPANNNIATRAEFLRDLRRELPMAMKEIIAARVGPVDFEQAVIGPGMGVFSRYMKVLEEDDSSMSVKTALALINRVRLEVDAETGNFDPETQVALTWFRAHGYTEKNSGEAILLANAKGVALESLFASRVFRDGHGKARLVKRNELPAEWSPATDRNATIWECVQHTARALEQGGSTAAAALIKAMGSKAEDALSLAYRLYDIANAKGEAMEARGYAELAAEWPELETLAASLIDDDFSAKPMPVQVSLFG